MPTSTYSHIPTVVRFLQKLIPASILDVGLGNGKMGFIVRDFLDVMLAERYRKEDWKVRIDGVEIFPDYIQDHQKAIYDNIFIGDVFDVIDTLGAYDLVILADVLEHFEKAKAINFLDRCAQHCSHMIISIPLGELWRQAPVYGNPHEEHLSFWEYAEFEPFLLEKELFHFPSIGDYGCFLIQNEDYIHYRIREKADALFAEDKKNEAIDYMKRSIAQRHPNLSSEYILVDLLLRNNQIKEAIDRLKRIQKVFPEDRPARECLQKLMEKLGIRSTADFRPP
jgi:SAM-dependent methyltransferase